MNDIYLNQSSVHGVTGGSAATSGVSETELEQTVGVSLLADFNQQLTNISTNMKDQLAAKQELRGDLSYLQDLNGQTTVQTPSGEDAVAISEDEHEKLEQMGIDLNTIFDGNGGYYVTKNSLSGAIDTKQEELAGLNANSELVMLQIQSLVDQRKNAMMLLSNLMASRNESLTGIIRNLKN